MSKKINNLLVQNLSKEENCWEMAVKAARKELIEIEEKKARLLEAIPVWEELAKREQREKRESQ